MKKGNAVRVIGFLGPSLAGMSIFVLLPFLDAVRRSFFSAMGGRFRGVQNYQNILHNDAFKLAAGNTGKFLAVCIPTLLLISFLLALLVYQLGERFGALKTSLLIPMALPVASLVSLWQLLFHQQGVVNAMLETQTNWLNSSLVFWMMAGTYVWKNAGYNMILWLAGLYGISPSLYEAARVDGAGHWQQMRYITLPGLRPYLFTVGVLSLLNSFKVFREAYLLGGRYPHESIYLLQHLFNNWFDKLDVDKLCAGAVMMALCLFAGIFLLYFAVGRDDS